MKAWDWLKVQPWCVWQCLNQRVVSSCPGRGLWHSLPSQAGVGSGTQHAGIATIACGEQEGSSVGPRLCPWRSRAVGGVHWVLPSMTTQVHSQNTQYSSEQE